MATFMDVGLFGQVAGIFTFLLIFVIVYAALVVQKIFNFGDGEKGIYALIALSVAFLTLISGVAVTFIATLAPWFTGFIIFLFFVFFIFRMWTGDDDEFFKSAINSNKTIQWVIIIAAVLILISALSTTFGQGLLEDNPEVKGQNATMTGTSGSSATPSGGSGGSGGVTSTSVASNDFGDNVLATFVHPKVLGLILFLLVGFFTILFLARNPNPEN